MNGRMVARRRNGPSPLAPAVGEMRDGLLDPQPASGDVAPAFGDAAWQSEATTGESGTTATADTADMAERPVGHHLGRIAVFSEERRVVPFVPGFFHFPAAPGDDQTGADGGGGGAGGDAGGGAGETLVQVEDFQLQDTGIQADDGMGVERVDPGEEPGQTGGGDQTSGGQTGEAGGGTGQGTTAPASGFVDLGRTGTGSFGDPLPMGGHIFPRAFTDGGMTGTGAVHWGGGTGGRGNQGVGTVQAQTAPVYESRGNSVFSNADAWVRAGTGTIGVTRSWVGVNAGDQGNGYYITPAAAARINFHETLHVNNTKGHHDALIVPLEARIAASAVTGKGAAYTQSSAIEALRTSIDWAKTLTDFSSADANDNTPMKSVDTTDLASGSYPVNIGPGTVSGTAFANRIRLPSEANPPA